MNKVTEKFFFGDLADSLIVGASNDWIVLHCCKHPYHQELVGYRGNLEKNHPNYSHIIKGNRMALNIVDMNTYDPSYVDHFYKMFKEAFKFLDEKGQGKNVLIHCNEGKSRSPSIMMLYLKHLGVFSSKSFQDVFMLFKRKYPLIEPKKSIVNTVEALWDNF